MPPTETRVGDSRRDPAALLVLAVVLLALRVGVTMWEHAHPPVAAESDHAFPGAGAPVRPGP
jgi:hypothetical protein